MVLAAGMLNLKAQEASSVRQYVQRFILDSGDVASTQFIVYPTVGFSPETNIEFGLSGLLLYYAKKDTLNRLSEIVTRGFYTIESQYGVFLEHAVYTDKNSWFFLGNVRYQNFPVYFYGIGMDSKTSDEQRVEISQFVIRERILKKIKGNFFGGFQVELNQASDVQFSAPNYQQEDSRRFGADGSTNLGLGVGLVLDTRHNVLNVRDGYFSEIGLVNSSRSLASDYNFTYLTSDSRYFRTIRKNQVLALQLMGQFTWGRVPFNQLPQLGGPNLLRGYYLGRFRDNHSIASQVEYRFLPLPLGFSKRIGAVVFASTATAFSSPNNLYWRDFRGAAGAGVRFLLFPKKDIYLRFDYALTREGSGLYVYIGEAF